PRMVYTAFMQGKNVPSLYLVVRTVQPQVAATAVRNIVQDLAPGAPAVEAGTMREQVSVALGQEQALAMVASFFAALGLLLTAIGVYGLQSYRVTRRTREIGLRIALGAQRGQVLTMIVRQALALTALGLAAGLAIAV